MATTTLSPTDDRQVRLAVRHLGVWSIAKYALIVGILAGILTVIGFDIAWTAFSSSGGLTSIDSLLSGGGASATASKSISKYVNSSSVMSVAVVLATVQVVVIVIVGVIGALVYNGFVRLTGGLVFGFGRPNR